MAIRLELGSEYDLDLNSLNVKNDNVFYYLEDYNSLYLDSGRSAIRVAKNVIDDLYVGKGTKYLLPEFICESVIKCFPEKDIIFYKINDDLSIDFNDLSSLITNDVKLVFLMHYFGAVQNINQLTIIKKAIKDKGAYIIEDTTHSIFSKKTTIGDFMIASLRKWFPVSGAGVIYTKNTLTLSSYANYKDKINTNNNRSFGHILKYISIRNDLDLNNVYRNIFNSAEEELDNSVEIKPISDLSNFILSCSSISMMKSKRINNYAHLLKKLGISPINRCKNDDCPFTYVIKIDERDSFRSYLIDNKVYCAVHWPFYKVLGVDQKSFETLSKTTISLPIDQRYGNKEMDYLISLINKWRNKNA